MGFWWVVVWFVLVVAMAVCSVSSIFLTIGAYYVIVFPSDVYTVILSNIITCKRSISEKTIIFWKISNNKFSKPY